jgi:hypothetical protein
MYIEYYISRYYSFENHKKSEQLQQYVAILKYLEY